MVRSVLVTTSVVLLACLGACSDGSDTASETAPADAAVQAPESATPSPTDPYAWSDVPYEVYLEAAEQIGLRPDVLVPEAGFSSGLHALCRTSAADMVAMRSAHVEDVADAGTYSTAQYRGDEVGLRLGLACPQRMTDWTAAGTEHADTDGEQAEGSAVSGDDLDRATAEEHAEGGAPSSDGPEPSDSSDSESFGPESSDDYDHWDHYGPKSRTASDS